MKTLKTAVVVVLLLAVLYGLYMVLNKPESPASSDAAWPQPGPLQIETGTPAAPGELSPLLGWLAQAPIQEVRIEPIGLQAIYDRYHASEAS